MSVDSDLPVTEVSIQDTLKTAETGQEFTASTSSNDSVETINAEMQLEATADSHDLHPSNRRKTHKHLKVMTDLGRRRYDRREPYKSLSKRSDTSLSDDSTSNESRHRINHQNMTDSNTGVDNNTSVDLERNTNSFSFTKPIVSTNPGATKDPPVDDPAHSPSQSLFEGKTYSQEEWILIEKFWKAYDEILILSLFSILGILFRLLFATWFSTFDNVFNENSALFTNLPLNCFSCWLMGFLCSGNEALDIVFKRMASGTTVMDDRTRTRTKSWQQQDTIHTSSHINQPRPKGRIIRRISETIMRTRSESPSRLERESTFIRNKLAQAEMREVQLLALERRIRASPSLVLFPAKKQDIDVIEHYANGSEDATENRILRKKSTQQLEDHSTLHNGHSKNTDHDLRGGSAFTTHTSTSKFSHAWKTFSKVNIADGWDVGTTADAMKDGILLGLRVGFCGALSSFSSWNSDMVSLLCNGYVDSAIVGYILGLLVPIVSYRTGQHSAVYVFVSFELS
jgi:fluoride ion exporter CrcB/FEX